MNREPTHASAAALPAKFQALESGTFVIHIARHAMNLMIRIIRRALVVAALIHSSLVHSANIYAFGNSEITVPTDIGVGTVFARHTFTPVEVCGFPFCEITGALRYNKGSIFAPNVSGDSLETNVPGISVVLRIDGKVVKDRFTGRFTGTGEIQLIRNSSPISGGKFSSGSFNTYYILDYYDGSWLGTSMSIYLAGSVRAIAGACKIPEATIHMPTVYTSQFTGVGSAIGKTPFQIRVTDCPAGFNRVEFGFYPAQGVVSGIPGTLQLAPGSTTAGIGVQLTDDAGAPVTFQVPQLLADYDRTVGGNYSIPLTASYVQTAPDMRPGPVNAMMVVLLNYL
ncbi:fimbrial protein [Burkholderia multivorans]|nr:fimbrial protein [Burkholderia multivorans]